MKKGMLFISVFFLTLNSYADRVQHIENINQIYSDVEFKTYRVEGNKITVFHIAGFESEKKVRDLALDEARNSALNKCSQENPKEECIIFYDVEFDYGCGLITCWSQAGAIAVLRKETRPKKEELSEKLKKFDEVIKIINKYGTSLDVIKETVSKANILADENYSPSNAINLSGSALGDEIIIITSVITQRDAIASQLYSVVQDKMKQKFKNNIFSTGSTSIADINFEYLFQKLDSTNWESNLIHPSYMYNVLFQISISVSTGKMLLDVCDRERLISSNGKDCILIAQGSLEPSSYDSFNDKLIFQGSISYTKLVEPMSNREVERVKMEHGLVTDYPKDVSPILVNELRKFIERINTETSELTLQTFKVELAWGGFQTYDFKESETLDMFIAIPKPNTLLVKDGIPIKPKVDPNELLKVDNSSPMKPIKLEIK